MTRTKSKKAKPVNQKKSKHIVEDVIEATFSDMVGTFRLLRLTLMCNEFIIKNPTLGYEFPYHGSVGMLGGYQWPSKDILEIIKKNRGDITEETKKRWLKREKEFTEKADRLLAGKHDYDDLDIKTLEAFKQIYDYCYCMELLFKKALSEITVENKKTFPYVSREIEGHRQYYVNALMWMSMDMTQKYFELMGYWTAKMEMRAKKRQSGKGQKMAMEKRQTMLVIKLKEILKQTDEPLIYMDKGFFFKKLCETFEGSEEYPRHPKTVKAYKNAVENSFGKKIIWQKGAFLSQKGFNM